jgi:hypothetical protein
MNPYINMNNNMNPYMNPYMAKKNKIYKFRDENEEEENEFDDNIYERYERYDKTDSMPNCLSVAKHAENCLVCSKLYKQDRTIYIISIAILSIICILLLKKILDV